MLLSSALAQRSLSLGQKAGRWIGEGWTGAGHPHVLRPVLRQVLLACGTLLLLGVAWMTLSGGLSQLPRSTTPGQRVETAVQLACGVLSLLSVLTCFRWRRWRSRVLGAWAISLSATAGLSSVVWGPPSVSVGLIFAAGTALFALAINRLLRAGLAE